jgi:hypothetical protein
MGGDDSRGHGNGSWNFAVVESKELEDKDDVIIGYGSVARRLGYVGWAVKAAARPPHSMSEG